MLVTFVTVSVLLASVLLVLSNLGSVADDTAKALRNAINQIRMQEGAVSVLAFFTLWLTIFGLSYL